MMLRMSHLESEAICEGCGKRMTGMDSRDWAVEHVRETGHLVKLRSLHQVEPEPPGWNAVPGTWRRLRPISGCTADVSFNAASNHPAARPQRRQEPRDSQAGRPSPLLAKRPVAATPSLACGWNEEAQPGGWALSRADGLMGWER
jgi:hypothetical protein